MNIKLNDLARPLYLLLKTLFIKKLNFSQKLNLKNF
jgi:hypothetical protein